MYINKGLMKLLSKSYASVQHNIAIFPPVCRKGNTKDPDKYGGINLKNSFYKIYTKILSEKLKKIFETYVYWTVRHFNS